MKRNTAISDYLLPLQENQLQAYITNSLQVADVLEWILEQYGEGCKICLTTFSISEEFLRRLYFIERDYKPESFRLVLDLKATNKTLKLWPFISQVIDKVYLADNHSKVLLVESADGYCVSVVMSQNLTRGNRYESALVSTYVKTYITLQHQATDLITNHSVPFNDVFANRLRED